MNKRAILFGLVSIVAVLAMSPLTASAFKGPGKSTFRELSSFSFVGGGGSFSCIPEEGEEESIEIKGPVGEPIHKPKKLCTLSSSILKGVTAEVSSFRLSETQPTLGALTALGGIVSSIVIKASGCEITVPSGQKSLSSIVLANSGSNLESRSKLGGIKTTVSAGCASKGITGTSSGIWTENTLAIGRNA
jgi:hypothetical protein